MIVFIVYYGQYVLVFSARGMSKKLPLCEHVFTTKSSECPIRIKDQRLSSSAIKFG